jgi:uncharacterized membrane protein YkvA (DUF1232 family)
VSRSKHAAAPHGLLASLRWRARRLKAETYAVYLAARDPRTPWYARLLAAGVVAYALSPIDLIPDFVPILGYLDDLILVPLGIGLAIRLIPEPVMTECRARAEALAERPTSRWVAAVVIAIWLGLLALVAFLVWELLRSD